MRTQEQISQISNRFSEPYLVENFLTLSQVEHLVSLFNQQPVEPNKVYKNTGPITLDIVPFLDDPIVQIIFEKIKENLL